MDNIRRVYVEMVPTEQVKVCPMGPSLDQKERDGTITDDEAFILHCLRIHSAVMESEKNIKI